MSLGSTTAKNLDLAACYGDSHSTTWPATVYLALFNGDPAGAGTELDATGGYGRLALTNDTAHFAVPTGGTQANAVDFVLAASTAAFLSSFDHWAYMDSATLGAGNVLDCGAITGGAQTVAAAGVQVKFTAGGLVVSA